MKSILIAAGLLAGTEAFSFQCPLDQAQPDIPGLREQQMEVVARLTGEDEIAPGVSLHERSTPASLERARVYLEGLLREAGVEPQRQAYKSGRANIYGLLEATGPSDEYIVLGAHFDTVSRSPGANDNATGVAMAHAVAKYLGGLDCRSKNYLVVFFDNEEGGLEGSRFFARKIRADGLKVLSVHTVDQMGWDEDGDRAVELELPTPALAAAYRRFAAEGDFDIAIEPTRTSSTDHDSFRNEGFAAVGLTEEYVNGDTTPYYHLPGDTYETVNFDYLESSTRFFGYVLRHVAESDVAG